MACCAKRRQASLLDFMSRHGSRDHVYTIHRRGHHISNAIGEVNRSRLLQDPQRRRNTTVACWPASKRLIHRKGENCNNTRAFPRQEQTGAFHRQTPPTRSLYNKSSNRPSTRPRKKQHQPLRSHRLLQFFLGCPPPFQEGRRFTRKDLVSRRT